MEKRGPRPINPNKRFWDKVVIIPFHSCWEWIGCKNQKGYGQLRIKGMKKAHRLSYEMHIGQIPHGLFVCHTCDNPGCVRPEHLYVGSNKDNMRDRAKRHRAHSAPGSMNHRAKLSETQAMEILNSKTSSRKTAQKYGVDKAIVLGIRNRTKWKHL